MTDQEADHLYTLAEAGQLSPSDGRRMAGALKRLRDTGGTLVKALLQGGDGLVGYETAAKFWRELTEPETTT